MSSCPIAKDFHFCLWVHIDPVILKGLTTPDLHEILRVGASTKGGGFFPRNTLASKGISQKHTKYLISISLLSRGRT